MDTAEQTQCIIHAATEVFAEKGFEGARVEEIAERAGINKAGLYYHLGNKADIYTAVFREVMGGTIVSIQERIKQEACPEAKLKAYANELAVNVDNYQFVAPLMMREIISGAKNLPDECLAMMMQVMQILKEIVDEGVAQGIFKDMNAMIIHMLIINTLLFYISGKEMRERLIAMADEQLDFNHVQNTEELADVVTSIVLNALRKA